MARYRVGIIGCGYPCDSEGATGMGVPHAHAGGYAASPDTHCVLPGDIDCENASSLQAQHGGRRICEGDGGPLAQKSLDIIGTCPQPRLYAPMVIAAAEADVKATRCEKPMIPTYEKILDTARVCQGRGIQLPIDCQRRPGRPCPRGEARLKSGASGSLPRMGVPGGRVHLGAPSVGRAEPSLDARGAACWPIQKVGEIAAGPNRPGC